MRCVPTMKQKNPTPLYAVLQALVWGGFGIIISYAAPYFKDYGLTDGQYGLLLGIVSAVSFFVQLGLAELCTRLPRLTLQRMIALCGVLMAAASFALVLLPMKLLWLCLLYCFTATGVQALPSLVNALGMAGLAGGLSVNFGVARGIGSASFAVCSYISGYLIELTDVRAIPAFYTVLAVCLIVSALLFPKVSAVSKTETNAGGALWKNSRFFLVLVGVTLLYVSHNFLCNFFYQVAVSRGGDASDQGICLAIAAFCELPVMFLFVRMLKHGRADTWLKLSGVFMTLRIFGCYLAPNVGWLYAVQFFQLLGFALFSVASVFYIESIVDRKDTVRAQAMLASTCTLSNFLTFLIGGRLLDRFGVGSVLILGSVSAAVGTLILVLFATKSRRSDGGTPEVASHEHEKA